jgi:hypothetical protein
VSFTRGSVQVLSSVYVIPGAGKDVVHLIFGINKGKQRRDVDRLKDNRDIIPYLTKHLMGGLKEGGGHILDLAHP